MKTILITILIIGLIPFNGLAQAKHDYIWLLGYDPNNPASMFGGSKLDFHYSPIDISYFNIPFDFDAIAIIANAWGGLDAYTNGCEIMNREHQIMLNGDQINQGYVHDIYCEHGYPMGQGVLFLPHPGDSSKYGLFHIWDNSYFFMTRLLYTEVNRNGDNGKGEVILKNQPILEDTITDQLTAVRHGNGRDWWIVAPETYRNGYYFILWSPDGMAAPIYQQIGQNWTYQDWSGQAAFSPNGGWYARINPYNEMDLFRFDRCEGELYDPLHIGFPGDTMVAAGVAFSSNSRYLYASIQLKIYQYDLWASDIAASRVLVAEYDGFASPFSTTFFQAMLAPDEKIYLTCPNGVNVLHVIHNPNLAGLDCQVEQHGIILPSKHGFFTPNFAHYRLLDKPGSPCDTLGIDGGPTAVKDPLASPALKIWPNPTSGILHLELPDTPNSILFLADVLGRELKRFTISPGQSQVDLEGLPDGVYFVVCQQENGWKNTVGKVVLKR